MIKHITYKEQKLPIRISYRALNGFKKDTGKSWDEIQEGDTDFEVFEVILFHALISGYKGEGEIESPWTKEQMADILDECFSEFVKLVPLFFPKANQEEQGKDEGRGNA